MRHSDSKSWVDGPTKHLIRSLRSGLRDRGLFGSTLGCIFALLASAVIFLFASDIRYLYLRRELPILGAAIVSAGAIAAVLTSRGSLLVRALPALAWAGFSFLTILWSLTPAASAKAAMWASMYAAVFVIALRWPRQFFYSIVAVNVLIIGQGVDRMLVTQYAHFTGAWFNKNVQGAQLLLVIPVFIVAAAKQSRWSPYAGFALGVLLFLSALTRSLSTQLLVAGSTIAVFWIFRRKWSGRPITALRVGTLLLIICGATFAWWTIRPDALQYFGRGIGTAEGEVLTKTNTTGSLMHRVEMIGYGLNEAMNSFPLGTGAGSVRDLYPSMKVRGGLTVPDLHNYYVQQLMTTGVIGLALLVSIIASSIFCSWRSRAWHLIIPVFLFGGYLAFDVAAYYPPLMMIFFGFLGMAARERNIASPTSELVSQNPTKIASQGSNGWLVRSLRAVFVLLLVALVAYCGWFAQPCEDTECALQRRLADEATVGQVVGGLNQSAQLVFVEEAVRRNPRSLWAIGMYALVLADIGQDPQRVLDLQRQIALEFPAANLGLYVSWRDAAHMVGDFEEARLAEWIGLQYYPRDALRARYHDFP